MITWVSGYFADFVLHQSQSSTFFKLMNFMIFINDRLKNNTDSDNKNKH